MPHDDIQQKTPNGAAGLFGRDSAKEAHSSGKRDRYDDPRLENLSGSSAQESRTDIDRTDVALELHRTELRARQNANLLAEERLKGASQDREQRKIYARNVFIFLCVYIFLVFALLVNAGYGLGGFALSETVVITLLSTTTVNVIGIFVFVQKYLFYTPDNKNP